MMRFAIYEVAVGAGVVAISPLPSDADDVESVAAWQAALVVSLTQENEGNVRPLAVVTPEWMRAPIPDFGVPDDDLLDRVIDRAIAKVQRGGRVLFHCKGGCGRSGMAALRLMVLAGADPDVALNRLRAVRPCAVETDAQMAWATRPLVS